MYYRFEVACYLDQHRLEIERGAAAWIRLAQPEHSHAASRRVPFPLHIIQRLTTGIGRSNQRGVGRRSLSHIFSQT